MRKKEIRIKESNGKLLVSTNYIAYIIVIAFKRILREKDVTIAIVGKKGNAKSSLMLRLAIHAAVYREYYRKYHTLRINTDKLTDIWVDFEEEVLKYINWIPSKWLKSMLNAPRFAVVGLDEAGNAWARRRFNEEVNKILNETQQSNRFLGQIKMLTMPHLTDIDSGGTKNANFYIDMYRQGRGKVYFLTTDSYSGKEYRYAIRIHNRDYVIRTARLPKDIYKPYEKKKYSIEVQRYLDRIAKLEEIEQKESKDSAFKRAIRVALEALLHNPDVILTKRGKLKYSYITAYADVSVNTAYKVCAIYEAEGIEGLKARL